MISMDGVLIGCFKAVIFVLSTGNIDAIFASSIQRPDTKANCTKVKVAGMSNAFNIDFEDVLVSADDVYHSRHNT
jgi:hypothetical protein